MRKINSSLAYHSSYESLYFVKDFNNALNYCYTQNFNEHISISAGTTLEIIRQYVDLSGFYFDDENDPAIEEYKDAHYYFTGDLGIWANIYGLNIGVSCNQFFHTESNASYQGDIDKTWNATINYNWHITPSIFLENSLYFPCLNGLINYKVLLLNNIFAFKNSILIGITTSYNGNSGSKYILSPVLGFNIRNHFKALGSFQLYKNYDSFIIDNQIELHLSYQF